jgi:antitoxin component YwqK of YwqJK toxin-antitoxin module
VEIKKCWYRLDGNVLREVYLNENNKMHREDGPAEIMYYSNRQVCSEKYYIEGRLHRIDGPAYIGYSGNGIVEVEEYFLNGIKYEDMFKYSVMVGSLKGV